ATGSASQSRRLWGGRIDSRGGASQLAECLFDLFLGIVDRFIEVHSGGAARSEVVEGGLTQRVTEPRHRRGQFLDKRIGREDPVKYAAQKGRCFTAAEPLEQNDETPDAMRHQHRLGGAVPGVQHRTKAAEG